MLTMAGSLLQRSKKAGLVVVRACMRVCVCCGVVFVCMHVHGVCAGTYVCVSDLMYIHTYVCYRTYHASAVVLCL